MEGVAALACEVRAPYMMYCERSDLSHSDLPSPVDGAIKVAHDIPIPKTRDQRIYFLPAVVLKQERMATLSSTKHGVSSLWDGRQVRFPKGAILAGGKVFEDVESVVHLLRFKESPSTKDPDVIRSYPEEDEEQWRFVVELHPNKMVALHHESNSDWLNALSVGCIAQMLSTIRKDFSDHEPSHEALRVLAEMIRDKTGKAPPWETEGANDEWEDTLHIATSLHNLITPMDE
ncbi:MAG: hypothetical protein F4Y08_15150 [Caldilineaceae bacterium SB0662_bin_9]|uniref:Uncharacterized protein n=1 Tax=Caldilineaceae bacterium SB0662_bin_9 TaxID=2605258 RepID=A0A6B1DZ67_9CHLR|nr:hypothetical protein [Caldilineaceae bacterium SB0662_bin_9]